VPPSGYHDDLKCTTGVRCFKHQQRDKLEALFATHLQAIKETIEVEIAHNIPGVPHMSSDEIMQLRYKGGYLSAITDMLVVCKAALTKGFEGL